MTRAVVFDCFGVLVTDAWLPFKEAQFGHDKALFEEAGDLLKQADAGMLSHDVFIKKIAELAGMPPAEVSRTIENNAPNEKLFTYIRELKPHYKIGMLSNAAANWLKELFTPEQLAVFDAISLSYEAGITKPNERSYEVIAERLGVAPEECVMVDDQERHVTGAKEAGMATVLYKNFDQFEAELNAVLGRNG